VPVPVWKGPESDPCWLCWVVQVLAALRADHGGMEAFFGQGIPADGHVKLHDAQLPELTGAGELDAALTVRPPVCCWPAASAWAAAEWRLASNHGNVIRPSGSRWVFAPHPSRQESDWRRAPSEYAQRTAPDKCSRKKEHQT
jgi:hypothetical protein